MSLRTRLLLAFAVVVFIPIALLAFGVRREMTTRLSEGYNDRLDTVVEDIGDDLRARMPGSTSGSRPWRALSRTTTCSDGRR